MYEIGCDCDRLLFLSFDGFDRSGLHRRLLTVRNYQDCGLVVPTELRNPIDRTSGSAASLRVTLIDVEPATGTRSREYCEDVLLSTTNVLNKRCCVYLKTAYQRSRVR